MLLLRGYVFKVTSSMRVGFVLSLLSFILSTDLSRTIFQPSRCSSNRSSSHSSSMDDFADLKAAAHAEHVPQPIESILKPDAKNRHRRTLENWLSFTIEVLDRSPEDPYSQLRQVPSVKDIQIYLRFLARTSKGIFDTRVSTVTIYSKWNDLKRTI